ncbi:MAG: 3-deoxy-D-manno-octulosonic acid transferase [Rhodobacteraceae bacterium]|nr:MAG: 3-deoxy-D-manno-octulosonic acid transferase [Paracoccaceae bacterium]
MTPVPLAAYLTLSEVAGPGARLLLARRAARGKEDPARLGERMGRPSAARPDGALVWLHGASVGEGLAAAALAARMGAACEDLSFLLTTGTRASAALLAERLPPRTRHQFAPLDVAPWARRFLDWWRPALSARIDSELWPATLVAAAARGPLALVNARVSARSARRWALAPRSAAALLDRFALIQTQDAATAERLARLGADTARLSVGGALKAAAPPPEADPAALDALRRAVGARPVWLAASTHPGEEAAALDAHARAASALPGLLTIIAPRHPERGPEIVALTAARGLSGTRRSAGDPPGGDVHVADTLGEMGLWYRLARFAFLGGSLAPRGGHNPYEPSALGVALAHGGAVANFAAAYAALEGAAWRVADGAGIAEALRAALKPDGALTEEGARRAAAGRAALAPDEGPAERASAALLALIGAP